MSGIQQMLMAGAGSSSYAYLDTLAVTPRCVLSLKKLISTATLCVRVRRNVDGVEQDIGFAGSTIDLATLTAFLGGSVGSVRTFYDQTGNGEHAEQTTNSRQPQITSTAVAFGGSHGMSITSLTQGTPQLGVYMYASMPTAAAVTLIAETSANYNSNAQAFTIYRDPAATGGYAVGSCNAAGSTRVQSFAPGGSGLQKVTVLEDRSLTGSGEQAVWVGGASKSLTAVTSVEQTGNFTTYDFHIAARAGNNLFSTMDVYSWIIYTADTSSIRASIEAVIS